MSLRSVANRAVSGAGVSERLRIATRILVK
jgi:hypothetical protein